MRRRDEVRGQGLMLGIELDRPCGVLLSRAADAGLLISVTADSVIRLRAAADPQRRDEAAQIVAILCPLVQGLPRASLGHEARHEPAIKHYLQFTDFTRRGVRVPVRARAR